MSSEHKASKVAHEELPVEPWFDLEALMGLLQETRLGGQLMEEINKTWETWVPAVHVVRLSLPNAGKPKQYLVTWLEERVEEEVDSAWARSASEGFRLNALAQMMCMGAVQQFLPEVEEAGCAPAPKPNAELSAALEALKVPYLPGETGLSRRYSVLTNFPFRGACDICHLRAECPKAQGQSESFHSVLLPGSEGLE